MKQKPPLRVLHLADIHLGYRKFSRTTSEGINQREEDVAVAFKEALQRMALLKPDLILIAGDIFHSVRPSNLTMALAFRGIKTLAQKTKAPIVLVAGNHETPRRLDTGSALLLFREIDGVFVADQKTEWFDFPERGLTVCAVPHAALESLEPFSLKARDAFPYNILVSHLQTDETWMSDFGGAERPLSIFNPSEWDYVALGHVHMMKSVGFKAMYSGSTEHTSLNIWDEADTKKGFLEYQLPESTWKFHELTSPRVVIRLPPLVGPFATATELEGMIDDALQQQNITGKLVKLKVIGGSRELYRQVNHGRFKDARNRALHLSLEFIPQEISSVSLEKGKRSVKKLETELEEFCAAQTQLGKPKEVKAMLQQYFELVSKEDEAVGS